MERCGRRGRCGLALALALAGCTATVSQRNGVDVEGEILGGDRQVIWLKVHDGPGAPKVVTVERAEIASIDHPGNVGFWIGLPLAVAGVPGFLMGLDHEPKEGDSPGGRWIVLGFGLALGVTAVMPSIFGLTTWIDSRLDAAPPDEPPVSVQIAPGALQVRW